MQDRTTCTVNSSYSHITMTSLQSTLFDNSYAFLNLSGLRALGEGELSLPLYCGTDENHNFDKQISMHREQLTLSFFRKLTAYIAI